MLDEEMTRMMRLLAKGEIWDKPSSSCEPEWR